MRLPIISQQGCLYARKSKRLLAPLGFAFFVFTFSMFEARAQSSQGAGGFPEVESTWPGVRFQLFRIERIPSNRLVVAVRIFATDKAPRSGTFLGFRTPIPTNAKPEDIGMGLYDPKPFSLADSVMTDDQTGRRYPTLPPIAPTGTKYLPGATLKSLMPGEAEMLTVQFAVPAEMSSADTDAAERTASFLFVNAKGPIAKVPVPPPAAVSETAVESR
jgi:hypothetical protein